MDRLIPATRKLVWQAGVVVAAVGTPLGAQIARPLQGNALDANNQVGSGGLNVAAPPQQFNTADLFITGNVAGGQQFRAFSPIRSSTSFFATLPTSDLGRFRADSIGIEDVLRGRSNYQPYPYFERSSTIVGLDAIARGLNQPGSSVPRTSFTNLYPSTTLRADPTMSPGFLQPINPYATVPTSEEGLPSWSTPLASSPQSYLQRFDEPATSSLAQSPLFGPAMVPQFETAQEEMRAAASPWGREYTPAAGAAVTPRRSDERSASGRAFEALFGSRDLLSPQELAPSLFGEPTISGAAGGQDSGLVQPIPLEPMTGSLAEGPTAEAGQAGEASTASTLTLERFQPAGFSAYEDFVSALEWLQRVQQTQEDQAERGAPVSALADYQQAIERARSLVARAPRSYAGESDTQVNRYIIQAEERLRDGDFYQAASLYQAAAALDRENPLIQLGQGHALLFAGDYLGAVYHLSRGTWRFHTIAYFKIDLPSFLPDPSLLDIRRADLEKRLEQREDYRLRFLLGYAEYYSGLQKFGLPDLRLAADEARSAMEGEPTMPGVVSTAHVIAEFPDRLIVDESSWPEHLRTNPDQ